MSRSRPGRWIALLRLLLVGVAGGVVATTSFPPGYEAWAWLFVGLFAASATGLAALSLVNLSPRARHVARILGVAADGVVALGFVVVYSYQAGQPFRTLYLVPVIEAALRFGVAGGVLSGLAASTVVGVVEQLHRGPTDWKAAGIRIGVGIFAGIVVGRLRDDLGGQQRAAEERAAEAEELRDELGRGVDLLEAANRCSRALASSLDLNEAFSAFIRELRGLVPFDRCAIVLAEGGRAQVMATAGAGAETVFPQGTERLLTNSVVVGALEGQTIVQEDMAADQRFGDQEPLLELGLRSRLAAPLLVGPRAVGVLSLSRFEVAAFDAEEVELVTLLGRLVATAVQNIRVFEAERRTVEELRRLSALRADFVSLVSHELRSPMAAVMGSAQTLQSRWRELSAEQRDAFLALIADETNRLSALIADGLDTSRIEAGTFTFAFTDVDLAELVQDSVAAAGIGQDEVTVRADFDGALPRVRGDRERLRQVLSNLIDNAVKYSDAGGEVRVGARARDGMVQVEVRDAGPGIPLEQQSLIFEKFGRAKGAGKTRPGTGLGLFIARSIAEAHGGSLTVRSAPGEGATFVLALPAS